MKIRSHNASDWSKETAGHLIYRGFSIKNNKNCLTIRPPTNRQPRNISKNDQIAIDNWFEEKFGIRFRQTSIYCTGDIEHAKHYAGDYGEVRTIKATGNYFYCWSPKTTDLYCDVELYTGTNLHELLESLDYRCDGLREAIQSGNEIMITGNVFSAEKIK